MQNEIEWISLDYKAGPFGIGVEVMELALGWQTVLSWGNVDELVNFVRARGNKKPFPFRQSENETAFRLATLHYDFARLIAALWSAPEVTKAEILRNLYDDLLYCLALKDSTTPFIENRPYWVKDVAGTLGRALGILTSAYPPHGLLDATCTTAAARRCQNADSRQRCSMP